jgi:hypothetical protein
VTCRNTHRNILKLWIIATLFHRFFPHYLLAYPFCAFSLPWIKHQVGQMSLNATFFVIIITRSFLIHIYIVMGRVTTFRSTTDRIYDSGPIRL